MWVTHINFDVNQRDIFLCESHRYFFQCESETKKYHFDVIQTMQNKMAVDMIHITSCYNLIFNTPPINFTWNLNKHSKKYKLPEI